MRLKYIGPGFLQGVAAKDITTHDQGLIDQCLGSRLYEPYPFLRHRIGQEAVPEEAELGSILMGKPWEAEDFEEEAYEDAVIAAVEEVERDMATEPELLPLLSEQEEVDAFHEELATAPANTIEVLGEIREGGEQAEPKKRRKKQEPEGDPSAVEHLSIDNNE